MIRRYRDSDLDTVLEAWYAASLLAHPFLDEEFFRRERIAIRDVHLRVAETWVYQYDGGVVGFVALVGNEVGGLFVDPGHQGRGIGRALMDHARAIHGTLELDVFRDNSAGRAFYAKYGFRQVGEGVHEETGLNQLRLRLPG